MWFYKLMVNWLGRIINSTKPIKVYIVTVEQLDDFGNTFNDYISVFLNKGEALVNAEQLEKNYYTSFVYEEEVGVKCNTRRIVK